MALQGAYVLITIIVVDSNNIPTKHDIKKRQNMSLKNLENCQYPPSSHMPSACHKIYQFLEASSFQMDNNPTGLFRSS